MSVYTQRRTGAFGRGLYLFIKLPTFLQKETSVHLQTFLQKQFLFSTDVVYRI